MNKWISVKDRLPDKELAEHREIYYYDVFPDIEVIVMIVGATLPTAVFYDGENFYADGTTYQITHWQPMPEPPKGY